MTTSDWITIAAILLGPIVAVSITLWIEDRRKKREAKVITLRILLSTRDTQSDPSYQIAIKLIPVEFNDCPKVLIAHREYLEAANVSVDGLSDDEARNIVDNTGIKLTRLIFEMSQAVGLKIRETDIQTGAFGTRGFYYRDLLAQDSQKASRDIANILWMQTRLMAGESWEQVNGSTASEEALPPSENKPKKKK